MTCVLRVTAPGLPALAEGPAHKPYRVEGETAHYLVSDADFDRLADQIEDAIEFLRRYRDEIGALMALASSSAWLDFAVSNRHLPAQFNRLSPELVCLAGKAGIGLSLSLYPIEDAPG
jgi:hypothetical protein